MATNSNNYIQGIFSLTVKRLDFSELNVSESGTDTPICLDMFRLLNSKKFVEERSQMFFACGQPWVNFVVKLNSTT